MARCFLTGVEFRVHDGHVLNRSDAYRLLRTLRTRAESLERLIAQLSPLDEPPTDTARFRKRAGGRQQRMICRAVAEALAHAHPEIELFLSWPALLARNAQDRMRMLKEHPLYGEGISSLVDGEVIPLETLSREVLGLIDPRRELTRGVQMAIRAGICIRYRTESATQIATLIRSTISGNEDLTVLGVPAQECDRVRASLLRILHAPTRSSSHERQ